MKKSRHGKTLFCSEGLRPCSDGLPTMTVWRVCHCWNLACLAAHPALTGSDVSNNVLATQASPLSCLYFPGFVYPCLALKMLVERERFRKAQNCSRLGCLQRVQLADGSPRAGFGRTRSRSLKLEAGWPLLAYSIASLEFTRRNVYIKVAAVHSAHIQWHPAIDTYTI